MTTQPLHCHHVHHTLKDSFDVRYFYVVAKVQVLEGEFSEKMMRWIDVNLLVCLLVCGVSALLHLIWEQKHSCCLCISLLGHGVSCANAVADTGHLDIGVQDEEDTVVFQ